MGLCPRVQHGEVKPVLQVDRAGCVRGLDSLAPERSVVDAVRTGERFGLIRFGSRVDVYLPSDVVPMVIAGQVTTAGETVLADLTSAEPAREGIKA